jgi:DNA-binding GntR family transcriptional regulator
MQQGRRRTAEDVSKSLNERIAAGEWSDSGQLPAEGELARAYGVARETLRKALAQLREAGLVSNQQGRGWFLGSTLPAQPADVLTAAEALRQQIANGAFDNEQYFPSETKLAADLGFTRHKVRKVVAELEKTGHLKMAPGNGRVVTKRAGEESNNA